MTHKIFANRQRQKPVLQHRHSSDESYHLSKKPSPTHRRTSSFNRWLGSQGSGGSSDDTARRPSDIYKAADHLDMMWSSTNMSRIHRGDEPLPQVRMMDSYSPDSNTSESKHSGDKEDDESCLRLLDLIRELSFSTPPKPRPPKTKKRTDTAETEVSSSSCESSSSDPRPEERKGDHHPSPIGHVDLQQVIDLRRASPSPLVGLQYLPDGNNMFI